MTDLSLRVKTLPGICGIAFSFDGNMIPSAIEGYQPFYNSLPDGSVFQEAYFGKASVSLEETSEESNAGISYTQVLQIRFPGSDKMRAQRIVDISKAKYIMVRLSTGLCIVLGRNDFEQNARPQVQAKLDHRLAQVQFTTFSIMPSGYTPNPSTIGLPTLIPIDLIDG